MRSKRGKGGRKKSGKKEDKRNKSKKTQWGDEHKEEMMVMNISGGGNRGLSGEENENHLEKRRPLPRETQEKYDKLYRTIKRRKELDVRSSAGLDLKLLLPFSFLSLTFHSLQARNMFNEKMCPIEIKMVGPRVSKLNRPNFEIMLLFAF